MDDKKHRGSSMIFINRTDEVLLILRDEKPEIKCPGMWDIPGGHVEDNETPRECIIREMDEELGLKVESFELFQVKEFSDRVEHTFWQRADFEIADIILTEGQKVEWFSEEQIKSTRLAFEFNDTIEGFYKEAPFRRPAS